MERADLDRILDQAGKVKLIVIGVDGVLTDAGMYFNDNGDMLRKFNRRDGMGIQLLKGYDVKSAVVSSMPSPIV
ncbi:MAG: acylneuraminate cytidylyltransferase, partial [Chitinivibrionales bacterium]|nr:acylneuraminate cytidylyltransferase [Chitinivibrionales bacterium]